MYNPTAREWIIIREALAIHAFELAKLALDADGEKDGKKIFNEAMQDAQETTDLLKKIGKAPALTLVINDE